MQPLVVAVRQFEICSRVSIKFRPQLYKITRNPRKFKSEYGLLYRMNGLLLCFWALHFYTAVLRSITTSRRRRRCTWCCACEVDHWSTSQAQHQVQRRPWWADWPVAKDSQRKSCSQDCKQIACALAGMDSSTAGNCWNWFPFCGLSDGNLRFATYRVSFFEFLILSLNDGILEHFFLFIISIAILGDGSVVSWGDADFGDDIPAVRHQLKGVEQIQATQRAFAAILEDGSVVAWGHAEYGGDSSAVRDQPKGVQQIQATPNGAFAAILEDGSVITWGNVAVAVTVRLFKIISEVCSLAVARPELSHRNHFGWSSPSAWLMD